MVNPGDNLLQVIPENIENYYLILWVPNDAVPYISAGDKVNIRYEAFPAEKFGQFSATVKTISRTPASTQEMLTYKGAPQNTPGASVPGIKSLRCLKSRLSDMTKKPPSGKWNESRKYTISGKKAYLPVDAFSFL